MNNTSKMEIFVSRPNLPELESYIPHLKAIWDSKVLTNNGPYAIKLCDKLKKNLSVNNLAVFNNGTSALMAAIKALGLNGEIITTPFTFAATTTSIIWAGCKPVFVDIDPITMNISTEKIIENITDKTVGILAVHCYGNACDVDEIDRIGKKYNIKIIYDAAHAFGVEYNSKSILSYGDASALSFHATKVFNTVEGGAVVCNSQKLHKKVESIRNFGLSSENEISEIGFNGKMNEIIAAYGLLSLDIVERDIISRKIIDERYVKNLMGIDGVQLMNYHSNQTRNYSYFPIFLEKKHGFDRDKVSEHLKSHGIFCRKYFSPLLSKQSIFNNYIRDSVKIGTLDNAAIISEKVLCLPLYPSLALQQVDKICRILLQARNL